MDPLELSLRGRAASLQLAGRRPPQPPRGAMQDDPLASWRRKIAESPLRTRAGPCCRIAREIRVSNLGVRAIRVNGFVRVNANLRVFDLRVNVFTRKCIYA